MANPETMQRGGLTNEEWQKLVDWVPEDGMDEPYLNPPEGMSNSGYDENPETEPEKEDR